MGHELKEMSVYTEWSGLLGGTAFTVYKTYSGMLKIPYNLKIGLHITMVPRCSSLIVSGKHDKYQNNEYQTHFSHKE